MCMPARNKTSFISKLRLIKQTSIGPVNYLLLFAISPTDGPGYGVFSYEWLLFNLQVLEQLIGILMVLFSEDWSCLVLLHYNLEASTCLLQAGHDCLYLTSHLEQVPKIFGFSL